MDKEIKDELDNIESIIFHLLLIILILFGSYIVFIDVPFKKKQMEKVQAIYSKTDSLNIKIAKLDSLIRNR